MAKIDFRKLLKIGSSRIKGWINDWRNKRTDLMVAVRNLDEYRVKWLSHKTNVNALDKNGNTALMYLLDKNIEENKSVKNIIDMLVSAGINLDSINKKGETAIIYASKIGNVQMVAYLIGKGANVDIRNEENMKAINYAGDNEELRKLLNYNSPEVAIALHGLPQDPYHINEQKKIEIRRNIKFDRKILDENVTYEKNIRKDIDVWAEVINERKNNKDLRKDDNENIDEGYYSDKENKINKVNKVNIDQYLVPDRFNDIVQFKEQDLEDNKLKIVPKPRKKINFNEISAGRVGDKHTKTPIEEDIFKNPWK